MGPPDGPRRQPADGGLTAGMTADRQAITDLIAHACALLDDERFEDWIALCAPDFRYSITAVSEEIGRKMEWMNRDRESLRTLLASVHEHERSVGRLSRHVGQVLITGKADNGIADVESPVAIYHTDLDGTSSLYAVGRYLDRIVQDGGRPLLAAREVALQTRRFPTGSHIPL